MMNRDGSNLNGRVLRSALNRSLIVLIFRSMAGTCSPAAAKFKSVVPKSPLAGSNWLSAIVVVTCIPLL